MVKVGIDNYLREICKWPLCKDAHEKAHEKMLNIIIH